MGKVTDYLIGVIKKQVKNKGIVVWYDPDRNYAKALPSLNFDKIPVHIYEKSFFKLRKDIEEYLSCDEPADCIIYIPLERKKGSSPMIEAESAGIVMEPGGTIDANTRLDVIARYALKDMLSTSNIEEICKSVAKGSLNLEDLDKLAESGTDTGKGTVVLIFGAGSAEDIALKFLPFDNFDEQIAEKNSLPELLAIFTAAYGFKAKEQDIRQIRKELSRYVFLTEMLHFIKDKAIQKIFTDTPHATKDAHIEACRQLASAWRNRIDLKDAYEKTSFEIEKILSVNALSVDPEEIIFCDTFQALEQILYQHVCKLILADNIQKALDVIEKRKVSFWTVADPVGILRWKLLDTASKLIDVALLIKKELQYSTLTHADIIERYVQSKEGPEGWHFLDYCHRILENQYATFDEGITDDGDDVVLQIISKARNLYTGTTNLLTTGFLKRLFDSNFAFQSLPRQTGIFNMYVKDQLQRGKTAYFLVDALRYEMGIELFESVSDFKDKSIGYAVASIPTITDIGMTALLPQAEKGINITKSSSGDISPMIDETLCRDRKARIDLLKKAVDAKVVDVKLEHIIKPTKKVREAITDAEFVLVTSQEIDEICEGDNINLARKVMNDILGELARGIRNLNRMGIQHFIITSDHGYLFGEELSEAMKVDPPGGTTIRVHRRYWAGYGGSSSDSFIRVSSQKLGLGSDLEFAFPNGVAGFKAKGGARAYFHGGLSLQELIIPIISINGVEVEQVATGQHTYSIVAERIKITSRFFTVKVKYGWSGLFGEPTSRVTIIVKAGKTTAGRVATAVYGHEAGTSEISLEKDKDNYVTLMLEENIKEKHIFVTVADAYTGKELASTEKLELAFSF